MVTIFTQLYGAETTAKPQTSISLERGQSPETDGDRHDDPQHEDDDRDPPGRQSRARARAAPPSPGPTAPAFDPAKFQQRIEKRVDKALTGTTATAEQKEGDGRSSRPPSPT